MTDILATIEAPEWIGTPITGRCNVHDDSVVYVTTSRSLVVAINTTSSTWTVIGTVLDGEFDSIH